MPLDGRAVYGRLVQAVTERAARDGRVPRDPSRPSARWTGARRALACAIRRAGLTWDTVSKKLRGERRLTHTDLREIATIFGENAQWLATGQGPHGDVWIRQHFEALARGRGLSLPPHRSVPIVQRGTKRGRGRPRKLIRGRRRHPYTSFPQDPAALKACLAWLARNPDIIDEWVGRELDQGPQRPALELLLEAARRAEAAVDRAAAINRRALVTEVRSILDHLGDHSEQMREDEQLRRTAKRTRRQSR